MVSWNDAAEMNESVESEALVIPRSSGRPVAGRPTLRDHPLVLFRKAELVDLLFQQELRIAHVFHLAPAHHLANDHFDVLVADVHALHPRADPGWQVQAGMGTPLAFDLDAGDGRRLGLENHPELATASPQSAESPLREFIHHTFTIESRTLAARLQAEPRERDAGTRAQALRRLRLELPPLAVDVEPRNLRRPTTTRPTIVWPGTA